MRIGYLLWWFCIGCHVRWSRALVSRFIAVKPADGLQIELVNKYLRVENAMIDDIPDTGAVFTFGRSHFADNEPSHFFIKNDPVVAISCGDEHSAVICQNGRVFVFGGNSWGQLGLGHKEVVTRPSCVKWLKPHRALFVACGRAHTVFVTDTHAIYTVGCNDEGQLGTGDMEHHMVPQYVEIDAEDTHIKQISAGSNHTALLTESGRVFVCGSNSEGQLGLGEDTKSCLKFTELKFMEKIAFVECGYYHTVFITSKGVVFVTGDNVEQKLGTPNTASNIYVPEVLPLDTPIKDACCGANHTFLLSADETKILAFGSNEKGQLGMSDSVENVKEPTEIDMDKMFDGYQLKLVACGSMHTSFVTDNGLLYTCGESRHNKLCLSEVDDTINSNDSPANQYLPRRVSCMNGFIVDNVACGGSHTLLTATKGSNADFTNNDFNVVDEHALPVSLTELPPLQKVPTALNTASSILTSTTLKDNPNLEDVKNSNAEEIPITEGMNGNHPDAIDNESIDSLEANVSGSHIVNINDLEMETKTTPAELNGDNTGTEFIVNNVESLVTEKNQKAEDDISEMTTGSESITRMIEGTVNEIIYKIDSQSSPVFEKTQEVRTIIIPDKNLETANSPPPKSPILQDLLHVPDITQIVADSDDGQSENETIPCDSDKSSPQTGKTKTQAVMPIVRSEGEDTEGVGIDDGEGVIVTGKGRFARIFETLKVKESSCLSKGKVIEENVQETVTKGIKTAEETAHKVEETIENEIRDHTNSRTCTIL